MIIELLICLIAAVGGFYVGARYSQRCLSVFGRLQHLPAFQVVHIGATSILVATIMIVTIVALIAGQPGLTQFGVLFLLYVLGGGAYGVLAHRKVITRVRHLGDS